ncbi:hypothetical protein C349_05118 [Cryptococcus neoformans var. grubii Br795]|uniref:Uncharacterized protein n=1 Tax=Cryptococcus neoformans Tu259-1 TaxID=1230072 RepID=A0A854Q8S8_CRYNE|nr:hypothetical protein C361_05401 [Cryptococcus neoformans var. grubii Tu259-1]OXG77866.1 hypothetical protein C349_05118 [Cryptococcus neoformans var. grubii Br795]
MPPSKSTRRRPSQQEEGDPSEELAQQQETNVELLSPLSSPPTSRPDSLLHNSSRDSPHPTSRLPSFETSTSIPRSIGQEDTTYGSRPNLKVRWRSKLGEDYRADTRSFHSPRPSAATSEEEIAAVRRSVTSIFRRPQGYSPRQSRSDLETGPSDTRSSVLSFESDSFVQPHPMRRRASSRRSSASSWASSDNGSDDDAQVGHGGILSALLGLYGNEASYKKRKALRSFLRRSDKDNEDSHRGRARRRWSTESLFALPSRNSSRSASRSVSRGAISSLGGPEVAGRMRDEKERVHRNRRHQHLPHRSQDLNQPYIPSARYSNPLEPAPNITVAQRFRTFMTGSSAPATLLGAPDAVDHSKSQEECRYRTMAALMITTNSLMSIGSPILAHVAPASGQEGESSGGHRKISWYESVAEKERVEQEREQKEERDLGLTDGEEDNIRAMEEGMYRGKRKRKRTRGKRIQREMAVTKHVSNLVQRKKFIEELAKAVVNYGAPAHSVEAWLASTADILSVEASFVYLPTVLLVAFRDTDVHSTDVLFVRPSGGLELYRLSLVHEVYRRVTHDKISASQGRRALKRIGRETVPYSRLSLILTASVASAISARVAFSGSFIDILMSGALGALFTIVQFTVSKENRVFSNIFEIGMAGILSFVARGLGSSKYFCYKTLASASIVLILPGWHICLGALELGSKNIIAGGIRLVWAVVYTLFLSLGLGIGSEIWDSFGPPQPGNDSSSSDANATEVQCYRDPNWDYWWYTEPSDWWLFLLVPIFAFSLAVWFRADWRSKDVIVMVLVACAGYVVNYFLSHQISQTNVTSAVSAFTVGVLGNLYSRLGRGSAFPSMVCGILLLVPNAIAAAGGLATNSRNQSDSTNSNNEEEINTAVIVSIRMILVGVGLAVGLFASTVAIYPFGKTRRYIFSY